MGTPATAAKEAAAKLGVKFNDFFWTLGQYDLVILAEAPDDETMTAVMLKLASLGNVKSQTLRAFAAIPRSPSYDGFMVVVPS